jgi:hypothetical protein
VIGKTKTLHHGGAETRRTAKVRGSKTPPRAAVPHEYRDRLQLGQHDPCLLLVFAGFVFVADVGWLVALEEEDLAQALIGVNLGGQGRAIGDFKRDKAFPLRLKGGYVDDDAAAGVRGLADADGQNVTRDFEVLNRARQGERVGRNEHERALDVDERAFVKVFGVDNGGVDVGEDLEFVGDAQIVPVRGDAVRDYAFTHLAVIERTDHSMFLGHAADPAVTFDCHVAWFPRVLGGFCGATKKPSYRRNCSIDNMRRSPIASTSYVLSGNFEES